MTWVRTIRRPAATLAMIAVCHWQLAAATTKFVTRLHAPRLFWASIIGVCAIAVALAIRSFRRPASAEVEGRVSKIVRVAGATMSLLYVAAMLMVMLSRDAEVYREIASGESTRRQVESVAVLDDDRKLVVMRESSPYAFGGSAKNVVILRRFGVWIEVPLRRFAKTAEINLSVLDGPRRVEVSVVGSWGMLPGEVERFVVGP